MWNNDGFEPKQNGQQITNMAQSDPSLEDFEDDSLELSVTE